MMSEQPDQTGAARLCGIWISLAYLEPSKRPFSYLGKQFAVFNQCLGRDRGRLTRLGLVELCPGLPVGCRGVVGVTRAGGDLSFNQQIIH